MTSAPEDRPDHPPEVTPEPAPLAPPLTERELWGEVAAVLAIGVVPYFIGGIVSRMPPPPTYPMWIDTLRWLFYGACGDFVVLCLIYRSGEPWSAFGLERPRSIDLFIALMLFLFYYALVMRVG